MVGGFLATADDPAPIEEQLEWWLAVAGVQFAYRRLQREGAPGVLSRHEAIEVLRSALPTRPPGRRSR